MVTWIKVSAEKLIKMFVLTQLPSFLHLACLIPPLEHACRKINPLRGTEMGLLGEMGNLFPTWPVAFLTLKPLKNDSLVMAFLRA